MADSPTEYDETFDEMEIEDDEFDRLLGIVGDGVVGAAGGLVGTAMMTGVLLVAESVGVFSRESFAALGGLAGLEALGPTLVVGYLVFLFNGMVPFPLLFASVMEYLPGERPPVSGMVFGAILWTGFVLVFYEGFSGLGLALYVVLTLLAHLAYGLGLGLVFEYLSTRPDSLV
ncbi:DUF6789 family protein [Halogranum rubrum]|uniref:Uncharacterized protein n=1 Tax=Halogranum salarium B-1 TaxID=1210908 RepID=J3A0C9_9EURY|nr:DUF6789 family protein [Halogranum salarium]EJN58783.1 hypothetical protein HSB1_28640 [Halogranum salarium B-1]